MIVHAYQTAFHQEGPVKKRPIYIAEAEEGTMHLLELAFREGQNMFQPRAGFYSVSVGDVIELNDGRCFRVLGAGFQELAEGEDPTALVGRDARMADVL